MPPPPYRLTPGMSRSRLAASLVAGDRDCTFVSSTTEAFSGTKRSLRAVDRTTTSFSVVISSFFLSSSAIATVPHVSSVVSPIRAAVYLYVRLHPRRPIALPPCFSSFSLWSIYLPSWRGESRDRRIRMAVPRRLIRFEGGSPCHGASARPRQGRVGKLRCSAASWSPC